MSVRYKVKVKLLDLKTFGVEVINEGLNHDLQNLGLDLDDLYHYNYFLDHYHGGLDPGLAWTMTWMVLNEGFDVRYTAKPIFK